MIAPILRILPPGCLGLGLVLLYLGERTQSGRAQALTDAVAVGLLCLALLLAAWRCRDRRADRRQAYALIGTAYASCASGLLAYAALRFDASGYVTAAFPDLARSTLGGHSLQETLHTGLLVSFMPLLIWGVAPAWAMELCLGDMHCAPTLELWRLHRARRAARMVCLAACSFAGVNYAAATWNRRLDLAAFCTTQASAPTLEMLRTLTQPLTLTLFFPPANEVAEQLQDYLRVLCQASPWVHVERLDHAQDPSRAQALQVRSNGTLTLEAQGRHEALHLGLDPEAARDSLRTLDTLVQKRLIRVLQPQRLAYLTTGHREHDYAPQGSEARAGLSGLKKLLQDQGFGVRRLGLAEGLSREIPKDATLVLAVGPIDRFTPAEQQALSAYLRGGGRALLAIDAQHGDPQDALLAPLGLKVGRAPVAHAQYRVRLQGRRDSPYDLALMQVTSHPVGATLQRSGGSLGVIMLGASAVAPITASGSLGPVVTTGVLPAMPQSWEDSVADGRFDATRETYLPLQLARVSEAAPPGAAARPTTGPVTQTSLQALPVPQSQAAPTTRPVQTQKIPLTKADLPVTRPFRAVVLGDADCLTDTVLSNAGNTAFFIDSIRWLVDEPAVASDSRRGGADVPLMHRRQDDAIWFYGATFGIPGCILLVGRLATRRRGRRSRPSAQA
jgi:hypothetical protein